jgi:hypothetical protein
MPGAVQLAKAKRNIAHLSKLFKDDPIYAAHHDYLMELIVKHTIIFYTANGPSSVFPFELYQEFLKIAGIAARPDSTWLETVDKAAKKPMVGSFTMSSNSQ